jgi:hypothetical protein
VSAQLTNTMASFSPTVASNQQVIVYHQTAYTPAQLANKLKTALATLQAVADVVVGGATGVWSSPSSLSHS